MTDTNQNNTISESLWKRVYVPMFFGGIAELGLIESNKISAVQLTSYDGLHTLLKLQDGEWYEYCDYTFIRVNLPEMINLAFDKPVSNYETDREVCELSHNHYLWSEILPLLESQNKSIYEYVELSVYEP